jgi:hypothetical protein
MPELITDPNDPDYDPAAITAALKAAEDAQAAAQRLVEKDRKQREKDDAELATYRQGKRDADLKAVFEKAEVTPALAKFFPADQEATPEAVKAWAEAEGLVTVTAAPSARQSFITPTPGGISAGTVPVKVSMGEWETTNRRDPEQALRLLEENKVDLPRSPYEIYTEPFEGRR